MKYIAYGPALEGIPNIMVDCSHTHDTVLELSHWPQNLTPVAYKADTSAEIAIRFVASTEYEIYLRQAQAVSNDHYDVDGLLSIWPILHPEEALERAELLVQVAATGDFDCYTTSEAAKACLAFNALEQHALQPIISRSGCNTYDITGFLYKELLAVTFECLDRPELFQHLWKDEYRHVEQSREALASKQARLTEFPELDLAIVEAEKPLHDFAVYAATQCLRVLTIYESTIYSLRYRYESFVDLTSRPVQPRIYLDDFAGQLNQLEQEAGSWFSESVASAHPRLQFYTNKGAPSASSIGRDTFVEALCRYLAAGAQNPDSQWHSSDGWLNEEGVPQPLSLVPKRI